MGGFGDASIQDVASRVIGPDAADVSRVSARPTTIHDVLQRAVLAGQVGCAVQLVRASHASYCGAE
jgi:hypothetical protein